MKTQSPGRVVPAPSVKCHECKRPCERGELHICTNATFRRAITIPCRRCVAPLKCRNMGTCRG